MKTKNSYKRVEMQKRHKKTQIMISKRLKKLAKYKGVSMAQVARDTEISYSTIRRIFKGGINRDISELVKLADYFNVSLDYLAGR